MSVEALPSHYWNISWYNSSTQGDGGAGLMLNGIQHGNSTWPRTISDSLVLPKLSAVQIPGSNNSTNRELLVGKRYHLDVKALEAMLVCEIVSDDDITITTWSDESDYKMAAMTAIAKLPANCWHGGVNGTNAFYNFTLPWERDRRQNEMLSLFADLHLGPWESWQRTPRVPLEREWGEFDPLDQIADNPAGCPSIGVLYGPRGNDSYIPGPEELTVFVCSQKVAQIAVRAAFFENLTIDSTVPLIRRAVPIQYLNNGTEGIESFPYRPEAYLAGTLDQNFAWYQVQNLTAFPVTGNEVGSVFFNHLIYGPNGTQSPEKLAGKSNRSELMQRVQRLYSKYMALVIDTKFRAPLTYEESLKTPIYGTMALESSRLRMNSTSKTTLQIFLACMLALGFAAYLKTDLRTTLPRKPTSIASVMSLLSGSDLCGNGRSYLPEGAENMTSEELNEHLDGLIVRLGWWSQSTDGPSSSSDGGRQDENKDGDLVVKSEEIRRRRFGIDIGKPEQLGFRPESTFRQKLQALRRRKAPSAQYSTPSAQDSTPSS
ncbi:hypothetical protein CKM354_000638500 [Cercospora kikuchii]|uniref:Uncharacterized protein n=1 Tax=Cercospora kikuchii TaxID=84275 RepID=A0A9P3CJA1_9PEZI|nr:uncharacterized protein CKM354_000638500 [Cercospora kikuchii]GIZ43146.1 hypothetical protein CKM354_000638500 [Cercospora kikuchii]